MVWWGMPVVRLPDLKEMEVLAQVNEVDGPKLSVGLKAKVILDSYPEIEISGSIKEISQTAIRATRMAKTRIFRAAVSPDRTITEIMKPGMSAQVSVVIGETPRLLLVPRSAVRFENRLAVVMRLEKDNNRRPVAITILECDLIYFGIAEHGSLREGDSVVTRSEN